MPAGKRWLPSSCSTHHPPKSRGWFSWWSICDTRICTPRSRRRFFARRLWMPVALRNHTLTKMGIFIRSKMSLSTLFRDYGGIGIGNLMNPFSNIFTASWQDQELHHPHHPHKIGNTVNINMVYHAYWKKGILTIPIPHSPWTEQEFSCLIHGPKMTETSSALNTLSFTTRRQWQVRPEASWLQNLTLTLAQ